jgi:hypothetical protein
MMGYLLFLGVLAATGLLWALARAVGLRVDFFAVFTALSCALVALPIAVLAGGLVCAGVWIGVSVILYATGLLPTVAALPVWRLLPAWAWFAIPIGVVWVAVSTLFIVLHRRNTRATTRRVG